MNWIKRWLIKGIYKVTTLDNVIAINKGGDVFVNNIKLNKMERTNIIEEAQFIDSSVLFKHMTANRNYLAQEKLILKGNGYAPSLVATYLITNADKKLISNLALLDKTQ